jgi:hypothetical protein
MSRLPFDLPQSRVDPWLCAKGCMLVHHNVDTVKVKCLRKGRGPIPGGLSPNRKLGTPIGLLFGVRHWRLVGAVRKGLVQIVTARLVFSLCHFLATPLPSTRSLLCAPNPRSEPLHNFPGEIPSEIQSEWLARSEENEHCELVQWEIFLGLIRAGWIRVNRGVAVGVMLMAVLDCVSWRSIFPTHITLASAPAAPSQPKPF